jgi:hypothetical protein
MLKLDNPKNNIFGSEDKRRVIQHAPKNFKTKGNLSIGKLNDAEENNKYVFQTINDTPDINSDEKNCIKEDKNYISMENRKKNIVISQNIQSSKRLMNNPSLENISVVVNRKNKSENKSNKNNNLENEDNSNVKIILSRDNMDLDILNNKINPINMLMHNQNLDKKSLCQIEEKDLKNNKTYFFNPKLSKVIKKEDNIVKNINNKNKYVFYINCLNFVSSSCCRRKHILEPLNIILEKIDKEIEIKSYLRIKEDFLIMKELLFDAQDRDIFDNPYDFEEIYKSVKNTDANYIEEKGLATFWKKSFIIENNNIKKSKTKAPKVDTKFSEKFNSLGFQIKKFIK